MYSKAYVEITNVCNRACSFCHGTRRAPRRMSLDEFKAVAKKLQGLTKYIYFHVLGEPLTHPELVEMIKYARECGFNPAVTTNGTLLKWRSDELLSSGVYKVNISLHSFEEGSEEDFSEYIGSCLDFADRASRCGILTVLRLWNEGHDGGRNSLILDMMKKRFNFEWTFGSRGARLRDKLHLEYGERFEWPDADAENYGEVGRCYGLIDQFGILSDGTVVPCCLDADGIINLGCAFTEELSDVLSSERANKIREGFKKKCYTEPLCQKCGFSKKFK